MIKAENSLQFKDAFLQLVSITDKTLNVEQ